MGSEFAPRKAEKKRVKLKMAIQGPSGSGKTWGALALAKNLWPDAKICVVDTENESASLYADHFAFDTIPLGPPFTTARYIQCIDSVAKARYDVIILDSITPQWDGEGGILRRKEEMDRRPGSNGYANWATFTPEHEAFKQVMMQTPMHLIATMRSKQDYILVANDKGKQVPKKVGLAPIQRDQIDYEFTLVFEIGMDHRGEVSKDRTGLFNEKIVNLADPAPAEAIRGWLESGSEPIPETKVTPASVMPNPTQPAKPTSTQESAQQVTQRAESSQEAAQPQAGEVKFIPPNGLTVTVRSVQVPNEDKMAELKERNIPPCALVSFLGKYNGVDIASCIKQHLWPLLRDCIGLECHFQIKEADKGNTHYINIVDVIYVDGCQYRDAMPVIAGEVENYSPFEGDQQ